VVTTNLTTHFNQLPACLWTSHANVLLSCVNHMQYMTQPILNDMNSVYVTSFYPRLCPVNRIHLSHFCRYPTLFVSAPPGLFSWLDSPTRPRPLHCRGSTITLRHTTVGRNPLYEWSARRRDLYLTTHNVHTRDRNPCLPPPLPRAGFEPAIPTSNWP
jgi:hypothetical protein